MRTAMTVPTPTPQTTPAPKRKLGAPRKYDRVAVSAQICEGLKAGRSLESICSAAGMPHVATYLEWVAQDPLLAKDYTQAREIGYALMADEIIRLSDKTGEWVDVHKTDRDGQPLYDRAGNPVMHKIYVPLSADVIAHKRLQIDTRKWMLSKMLPKVYGDRVTQEHTGADGGPITLAAVDLKNLTDEELERMQRLLSKASAATPLPEAGAPTP